MQLSMKGRNALITGGSLGIGRAIAKHFAGAGANVALVARRKTSPRRGARPRSPRRATPRWSPLPPTSARPRCRKAFEAAASALGQIDVLVNNAGTSQRGPFERSPTSCGSTTSISSCSPRSGSAAPAFPGMKARRWGRIINVLNTGAKAPRRNGAPTAVTRAAGMALTKVLAGEGAPQTCSSTRVLVGRIESDQWVRRHAAESKGRSLEDYYAEMGKAIPMGRIGTAEEFANMVLFLASDAGSYITGTAINIDGNLSPVV